jgi:hypothetical protein
VIDAYGNMEWHKNGFRHRIMGPAVLHPNKKKQYWINGKNITIEANRWLKTKKYNEPFTLEQQVEFMLTFG